MFGYALTATFGRAARRVVNHPREFVFVLQAIFWLGIITLLTRLLTLPRALSIISPPAPGKVLDKKFNASDFTSVVGLVDRVLQLDFMFLTPVCWKRAMLVCRLLRRAGYDARLVFGTRIDPDASLAAHAWVEVAGAPVFEKGDLSYQPTFAYPPVNSASDVRKTL